MVVTWPGFIGTCHFPKAIYSKFIQVIEEHLSFCSCLSLFFCFSFSPLKSFVMQWCVLHLFSSFIYFSFFSFSFFIEKPLLTWFLIFFKREALQSWWFIIIFVSGLFSKKMEWINDGFLFILSRNHKLTKWFS